MMRRAPVSFFDRETGEFTRCRSIAFGRQPVLCHPHEDWKPGRFDPTVCRVDPATGEVVPLLDFMPVVDGNRISNLPEGTKAVVHLRPAMIGADGVLQVNVEYPQTIRVHLTRALHNHAEVILDCTPAGNAPGGFDLPQRYDRLRMGSYDPGGDQLGALWKGLQALAEATGVTLPEDAAEGLTRIRNVKSKYPKPEEK